MINQDTQYLSYQDLLNTCSYYVNGLKVILSKKRDEQADIQTLSYALDHLCMIPYRNGIDGLSEEATQHYDMFIKMHHILEWDEATHLTGDNIIFLSEFLIRFADDIIQTLRNNHTTLQLNNISGKYISRDEILGVINNAQFRDFYDENVLVHSHYYLHDIENLLKNKFGQETLIKRSVVAQDIKKNNPDAQKDALGSLVREKVNTVADYLLNQIKLVLFHEKSKRAEYNFLFFNSTDACSNSKYKALNDDQLISAFNTLFKQQSDLKYKAELTDYLPVLLNIDLNSPQNSEKNTIIIITIFSHISELLIKNYIQLKDCDKFLHAVRGIRNFLIHSMDAAPNYANLQTCLQNNTYLSQKLIDMTINIIRGCTEDYVFFVSVKSEDIILESEALLKLLKQKIEMTPISDLDPVDRVQSSLTLFANEYSQLISVLESDLQDKDNYIYIKGKLALLGEVFSSLTGKNNMPGGFELLEEKYNSILTSDSRINGFMTIGNIIIDFRNQLTHAMTDVGYSNFVGLLIEKKNFLTKTIELIEDQITDLHEQAKQFNMLNLH